MHRVEPFSTRCIVIPGYRAIYIYNSIGNILSKVENSPTLTYTYQDSAHKHAVTHLKLGYDCAGSGKSTGV
jgi:hypothetical protein